VEHAREMATGYEDTYRDLHQPAVVIGGCFAIVAVLLSIYLIFQHLKSYTNPAVCSLIKLICPFSAKLMI
jgi:hypothetical protein